MLFGLRFDQMMTQILQDTHLFTRNLDVGHAVVLKVHITPLTKFHPENPCGVKRSHTKISGIGLGVFLQLSFSSFEKIQNYDVTSGNHY